MPFRLSTTAMSKSVRMKLSPRRLNLIFSLPGGKLLGKEPRLLTASTGKSLKKTIKTNNSWSKTKSKTSKRPFLRRKVTRPSPRDK